MRVMVYKARDGKRDVLVLPSVKSKERPTSLRGLNRADVKGAVAEVLAARGSQPEV